MGLDVFVFLPSYTQSYWVLLSFTGFYLVLLGFTQFCWVLPSFTGFYMVLPSFTGFYLVLLGFTQFYWVLPSFTGFYLVLLGFTQFYWVSKESFHFFFIENFTITALSTLKSPSNCCSLIGRFLLFLALLSSAFFFLYFFLSESVEPENCSASCAHFFLNKKDKAAEMIKNFFFGLYCSSMG